MRILIALILLIITTSLSNSKIELMILGTLQDGGAPHIGCQKKCCEKLFDSKDSSLQVVSLGIIDRHNQKKYIIEATPDFPMQIRNLWSHSDFGEEMLDGIFLTHAHIGHYTGLMYLGREAKGSNRVPVYAMPKMKFFLENNGPWSQLVKLENIIIKELFNEKQIELSSNLRVLPFRVPHRDEFSETVGYKIIGPNKTALFIPDIDKWSKWEKSIIKEIQLVDYAFIDATFYSGEEINTRDISEIPHPFVEESMKLFEDLKPHQKSKVYFIHFNHTNPLIKGSSTELKELENSGFNIARYNDVFQL